MNSFLSFGLGSTEQSDNENDGSKSGTIKRVEPKATGGLGFNIIGAANAPNIPDEKDNIEKESQKDLNELNNNLIGGGGQYANADDEVDDDDDVDQTETTGSWLVDKNKKDKQVCNLIFICSRLCSNFCHSR